MSCTFAELYTEKEIWNTTNMDEDDASSFETIANDKGRKEVPHGLVRLNTQKMVPCNARIFIAEGLQYEIALCPTTIKLCSVY
ncbi:hypothetical protein DPMN_058823 [Dreissena polymorpha]|uniref:Uncharacterized protein n=1 Tax=Dreissena polymorpha TaxID=45954 RepID=A0A9D4HGK3_DREPO|nr:hypothetical protein DPMN_058823 [Dreissena polymorpha]